MKPLIVLIVSFLLALITIKLLGHGYDYPLSGRIAMSVMLLFTSIAHFAFTNGMVMMMPGFVPYKKELVYFTGIIEILAAIGLQIPRLQVTTAWLLIAFFVLLLPANINAAIQRVDYQKGTLTGNGINYLWFRVPLQVLFIAWTYLSAISGGIF
jgi:uncharacterized membrane protein